MDVVYFVIHKLNIVAKIEDDVPYVYKKGKGWIVDNDNILMDRIMDYGDNSVMDYDEISEEKALKLIKN